MSGHVLSETQAQQSGVSAPIASSRPVHAAAGQLQREKKIRAARQSRAHAAKREAVRLVGSLISGDSLEGARLDDLLIAIQQGFAADSCVLLIHHLLGTCRLVRAVQRPTPRGRDSDSAQEVSVTSVALPNLDNARLLLCGEGMVACLHKYVRSSSGDRLLAVLSIQQRTPRKFDAGDVALLDAIGDLLCDALERSLSPESASQTGEGSSLRNVPTRTAFDRET